MEQKHAVANLIVMLQTSGQEKMALRRLEKMKSMAAPAIPAIAKLLNSESQYIRNRAATTLGAVGKNSALAVKELLTLLCRDAEDETRFNVLAAIRMIGPAAHSCVPAVIEALNHEDEDTRMEAAFALGQIGRGDAAARQALRMALMDEDCYTREAAAFSMYMLSDEPMECVINTNYMEEQSEGLLKVLPLMEAGVAPDFRELVYIVREGKAELRRAAAWVIEKLALTELMGCTPAVDSLRGMLKDTDWRNRAAALDALACISPIAKSAIPDVKLLLRDPDFMVMERALEALREMEELKHLRASDVADIAMFVINATPCYSPDTLSLAIWCLGCAAKNKDTSIRKQVTTAIPSLVRRLRYHKAQIRHSAVQTLGNCITIPETAIELFKDMAVSDDYGDDDYNVSEAAEQALRKHKQQVSVHGKPRRKPLDASRNI